MQRNPSSTRKFLTALIEYRLPVTKAKVIKGTTMSVSYQKGIRYPSLRWSSFHGKEDNLPPEVLLPHGVERAVVDPLPELRDVGFAKQMLESNVKLLDDEEARKAELVIAEAEARKKAEAERAEEEAKEKEARMVSQKESEDRAMKIESLCNITSESRSAAARRLERFDWDIQKALQSIYGD